MKFIVDKIESLYDGFFKLFIVDLRFEKYNGEFNSASIEVLDRGDSAAVLLYQKDTNELLLVEQFRYPMTKSSNGWIMELLAGRIEENEFPEKSIVREIEEEIGYEITNLRNIGQYYLSPGGGYNILETRGGYHILVEPAKINITNNWYQQVVDAYPVDKTGDNMIPVPGCVQSEFIPRLKTIKNNQI